MRNHKTRSMGLDLDNAFRKSGMALDQFFEHLVTTRDVHGTVNKDTNEANLFVVMKGEVYQFYFTQNQWYCKA